jgi:ATP-dependent Lon protease
LTLSSTASVLVPHTQPVLLYEKGEMSLRKDLAQRHNLNEEGIEFLLGYWTDQRVPNPKIDDLLEIAVRVKVKRVVKSGLEIKLRFEAIGYDRLLDLEGTSRMVKAESDPLNLLITDYESLNLKVKRRVLSKNLLEHAQMLEKDLDKLLKDSSIPHREWMDRMATLLRLDRVEKLQWIQHQDLSQQFQLLMDYSHLLVEELKVENKILNELQSRHVYRKKRMQIQRRIQHLKETLKEVEGQRRKDEIEARLERLRVKKQMQGEAESELGLDDLAELWQENAEEYEDEEGYEEDEEDEEEELTIEERISKKPLTAEAKAEVKRVTKLQRMGGLMGPEIHNIRNFLEVVAELPWETRAQLEDVNVQKVEEALNAEHDGLDEVKERILEHLAVSELADEPQGSVLCLAGPPGVGKTSLVKVIAKALGRPFVRISLGGVQDEADIRGHRRTYVSATPGRICDALKQAKVKNPVVLLDEIDKVGLGHRGNPESALLEVLDPEQNANFRDHYLEIPLDLSEVLFICTANDLRNMSPPLKDRLECVELTGYSQSEKQKIALNHLLPTEIKKHGLQADALTLSTEIVDRIIDGYTREAGVRQLKRAIAKICRKLALDTLKMQQKAEQDMQKSEGNKQKKDKEEKNKQNVQDESVRPVWNLDSALLTKALGPIRFNRNHTQPRSEPGVANGLAWTSVGGSVLHIETAFTEGTGKMKATGSLGDVMKESVQAVFTALRVQNRDFEADIKKHDYHVHFPEGATPKDGPSAGVTLYCALYSLLSQKALRSDVALSGECTLQGRILAVGGLREKLLAAQRENMKTVILPKANQDEVLDFDDEVRGSLELVWVTEAKDALKVALAHVH